MRSRNPRIDVKALEKRVEDELIREPQRFERRTRLAATVHMRSIEHALVDAEARSQPRNEWPADLRLFPLTASRRLRATALRFLALAFRDQHEVNAALIRSQRELLALNQALLDRVAELEARVERERASARSTAVANRRNAENELRDA